jgi:hypothetical protein
MDMEESDDSEKDPEAAVIVAKLRKQAGGGKVGDDEDKAEEGDAGAEARRSAVEDVFQTIRGRAPTDEEADKLEDALKSFYSNC